MNADNFRKCLILLLCSILFCLRGYSQAPNISYTAPAPYKTGTAITPLSPKNTGGSVPAVSYASVSPFIGGTSGYTNGSGPAAQFYYPYGVALDASGNLYIADSKDQLIRKATPAGLVSTFAGTYEVVGGADGPGATATFNAPYGAAVDAAGNIYISETGGHKIRKITPAGVVSTFAGNGTQGLSDGNGTAASFNVPEGLCFDKGGNLYVADIQNNNIRKITPAGVVSTFAGSISGTSGAANGNGTAAAFYNPTGIVVSPAGNFFVTDAGNHKIREITAAGLVSDFVGDGTAGWRDGTGTSAALDDPYAIAVDELGNLYEAEYYFSLIRKITPAGVITTIAGNGIEGSASAIGNAATFNDVKGIVCDGHGNLYIGEGYNSDVRKMNIWGYSISPALPDGLTFDGTSGTISGTPLATVPVTIYTINAYNASGSSTATVSLSTVLPGSAPQVTLLTPALASAYTTINITGNNLLGVTVVTVGGVPAKSFTPVSPTSLNVTIPGTATSGIIKITTPYGSVTSNGFTLLNAPKISYSQPPVYVTGTLSTALAPVNSGGEVPKTGYGYVSLLAGNVSGGSNDGTGKAASFNVPHAGVCDIFGNLYVADIGNNLIRKVTPNGVVTTFAGGGRYPNDGTGKTAGIAAPAGITIDGAGNFYVTDSYDELIRKITTGGVVTTLAGSGRSGTKDGKGVYAWFSEPNQMGIDAVGNLYCGESLTSGNIRKITMDGVVTTFASDFNDIGGIIADDTGNLYVADRRNELIKKITPSGGVSIFAGNGAIGKADGLAASASFSDPDGLATDHFGNLYICETGNNQLRMIDIAGNVSTITPFPKILDSYFYKPNNICADDRGNIYVLNGDNTIKKMSLTGYSITPDLPAGLTFDASTGTISGTPVTATSLTSYLIVAYNTSGNSSYTIKFAVAQGKPMIKSFAPTSAATGITVTITGSSLSKVTSANFGSIAAASFKVVNDTTVTAVVGTGSTGNITLATATDTASKAGFNFIATVTLSKFSPVTAAPGGTVKLNGSNFTSVNAVSFGGTAAASFKIVSDSVITAVVGTGASGSVRVTSPGNTALLSGFKFINAPAITSFSPLNAGIGATVTINGTGFNGATAISFGGVPATSFTVTSDASLTAVIGQGASGNIVITTPGGTSTLAGFKFVEAPDIISFAPSEGKTGDAITITGSGFATATAVSFGGADAGSFVINADNSITAIIGQGASGDIKVTTPGGTGTVAGFNYISTPAITSFDPASAVTGTKITITGTNFTGATAISFGGVPAVSFSVLSPSIITAVVGSGSSGNVVVTTTNGQATLAGFIFEQSPVITSITPANAAISDTVTIKGTYLNEVTGVSFGGVAAESFSILSPTTIKAEVGLGASGDVTVVFPAGSTTLAGFTYIPLSLITSFSPVKAQPGDTVTISGFNLTPVTAVSFGLVAAKSFTIISANIIKAVVGSGASGDISITGPGGTVSLSGFVVNAPPALEYFSPETAQAGMSVTITGSNLTGTTAVSFGGVPAASFKVILPGEIKAVIAAGATGAISVKNQFGAATLNGFTFLGDLPADNLQLSITSVSCKGGNNGSVNITAKEKLSYLATIIGNGVNKQTEFFTTATLDSLTAGNYSICITAPGQAGFNQCYTVNVTEPKDLSVYAVTDNSLNTVTLALSGGNQYNITLNGILYTTSDNAITLSLNEGSNNLSVTTDRLCQGAIRRSINIFSKIIPYPVPFQNTLNLDIGSKTIDIVLVEIHSVADGKMVYSKQFENIAGLLQLDVSGLKDGIYALHLSMDNIEKIYKIIKK